MEDKVGNNFEDINKGNSFLNRTPILQALGSTINKNDLMKMKSFSKASYIIKNKLQTRE